MSAYSPSEDDMAFYDYYRAAPGWGTSSYQFVSPRLPSYQPQPSWGGLDYYNAHGGADPYVYDYARNRVLSHPGGAGIGIEEAKVWHRRAYSGMGDIRSMLPSDLGAAAAYEVWRNWKYHYGVYAQPLAGDRERQQDALIGLATSEAARLWDYTGQSPNAYGRLEAVEAAAGTVARILSTTWALEDSAAYGGYAGARTSPVAGVGVGGFSTPAPGMLSRRASAVSLRGRALSRPSSPFMSEGYGGVGSAYGGGSVYGGAGSVYGDDSYADPVASSGALVRRASFSAGTPGLSMTPGLPYAGSASSYGGMSTSPSYAYANSAIAPTYGGGYSAQGYYGSEPSPIVIQQPASHRRRSRSRHRSGSHHRSSSHHRSHRHSSYMGSNGGYYVPATVSYGY